MVDVRAALATLGWRVNTAARLEQAVEDFQRGWNLGPALTVDGNAGPKTVAALSESLARRAAGKPDFSANFSAIEFRCECSPIAPDCRRIWIRRAVVSAAEKYRTIVGPFTPDRGCRCPQQNAKVGGSRNSQHLYGNALDVPVYNITSAQLRALRVVSAIGVYLYGSRRVVRHFDLRHLGPNTTGGTIASPTVWDYGTAKSTPLKPMPVTDPPPTAPRPTPTPALPLPQEAPVFFLVQVKDTDPVYKSDGFRRVHIDKTALGAFVKAGAKVTVLDTVTELDAFGPLDPTQ